MDEPPLTEEQQLELVKNQVNKMVEQGVYTPPPGWEPYEYRSRKWPRRIDAAGKKLQADKGSKRDERSVQDPTFPRSVETGSFTLII